MGKFGPVFLAFALNSYGLYIFRTPKDIDSFPYMSYLIFLLSMFALLWDISFYASSFRKLYFWVDFTLEFLIAMFIMEIIMNDFWLPLENAFIAALPKVVDFISTQLEMNNLKFDFLDQLCNYLKSQDGLHAASYALSIFFFLSIAHATRLVDFRILKCHGHYEFIADSTFRTTRFLKLAVKHMIPSGCREARRICFASGTKERSGPGTESAGIRINDADHRYNSDH